MMKSGVKMMKFGVKMMSFELKMMNWMQTCWRILSRDLKVCRQAQAQNSRSKRRSSL